MPFVDALIIPFSKNHLSERLLITMGIFAIPGVIVALGMRHRGRAALAMWGQARLRHRHDRRRNVSSSAVTTADTPEAELAVTGILNEVSEYFDFDEQEVR
jgi:hypothetical protein